MKKVEKKEKKRDNRRGYSIRALNVFHIFVIQFRFMAGYLGSRMHILLADRKSVV